MKYLKNKYVIILFLVLTAIFQANRSSTINTTINNIFEDALGDLQYTPEITERDINFVKEMKNLVTSQPVYLLINLVEDFIIIITFGILYWFTIRIDIKIESLDEAISFGEIINILCYQLYILSVGHILNGVYMLIMKHSIDELFYRMVGICEIVLLASTACYIFKKSYITKRYSLALTHLISGTIMAGGIAYFLR